MGNHCHRVKTIVIDAHAVEITDKEERILKLLADGYSNKEIAEELRVDSQTVKNYYMPPLLRKLGANNRAHAVSIAFRKGLVK